MEFRLLGPLEASEAGETIPLGGPKQRMVLTHLLLRPNQLVPADRLIDEVWGDDPPDAVRSSLQSYISHLRKALGPDRLEGRTQGYVLHLAPSEIDVARFEALIEQARAVAASDPAAAAQLYAEALGMWRGNALDDLAQHPSLRAEIARLEALRAAATEERVAAELEVGRHRELVPELETLTAHNPLSERMWGHLMVALYRSGRQGDALAAFRRARTILSDELGIEPSPELQRLHEQVLRQEPALEVTGTPLRGYRLLDKLGEGAFGVVHRAFQSHVNREVAVKAAHPSLANNAEFIRRFEREAQLVARLEHPHIVPLYDYWREPDGAYLVMRLMRGGSLRDALDGHVEHDAVMTVAEHVGLALATAHRLGVIHRDIKPENILFDGEGNAYLSDFGIAKDVAAAHTAPAVSPTDYSSPEELRGEDPSPRSDIFSLGRVLEEMVSRTDEHPRAVGAVIARALAEKPDDRFDDVTTFTAALSEAFAATSRPAVAADPVARNPYRGLRPFLEPDADDFFGRESLVAHLVDRLSRHVDSARFLTVVGPSGSGKSSLIRAGLVPALRRGAVPGSERWFVVEMLPGGQPFAQFENALLSVAATPLPPNLADRLAEGTPESLVSAAHWALPDDTSELLLVVDQFEELFTLVEDERLRSRFINSLVTAVGRSNSRVRVVATLRADFYDRPLRYHGLADLMGASSQVVGPLSGAEIERAVVGPAQRVGVGVDAGLVGQIVADVGDQPGALPLLQYALTELFDRRAGNVLTAGSYREIGGVAGALARRAEAVFDALDDAARDAARQMFLRLVTLGEGTSDTRRRIPQAELLSLPAPNGGTASTGITASIDAFGRARLLSFDREPDTREPTVEVAHESLLHEWARLRQWIDEAREDVRTQRWVAAAAHEWVDAGRDPSFLVSGSRLQQLESWQQRSTIAPSPDERDFLDAAAAERDRLSDAEAVREAKERALERRSYRRMQALVALLAVAALVGGSLTVYAVNQGGRARQAARVAVGRELAAAAVANLDTDAERSILLALAAVDETREVDGTVLPEAEDALHRAVAASRIVMTVPGVGGLVDWSPDGRLFATEGPEETGLVDVRDATTGESVLAFTGHDIDVNDVAFSPDGSLLATTGDDGALRIWDADTGAAVTELEDGGQVWGPAFSPDGSLVAAAWMDGGDVRVVDVDTGRTVLRKARLPAPFATGFSPDGKRLAVSLDGRPEVLVLDAASGEVAFTLRGHLWPVKDVDWSPDGRWIATTANDLTARIWDGATGEPLHTLHGHTGPLVDADWSPASTRLVTGSVDGTARVWEIDDDGVRHVLSLSAHDTRSGLGGVAFSPDGDRVMTGDAQINAVRVWDVSSSGDAEWANLPGDPAGLTGVAFTPDGRVVASMGRGEIGVWDIENGTQVHTLAPHSGPVFNIDVSPDGALVATSSEDETVVWDATTGTEVFRVPVRGFGHASWSPDGERLVVSAGPRGAAIFDRTGHGHGYLVDEGRHIETVAFSPDGRYVAASTFPGGRATATGPRVSVWDWERRSIITAVSTVAEGLAFDPSGELLLTSSYNGVPTLWDVETGDTVTTLSGHTGPVFDVAFSPDGSLAATAGADSTVRLWRAGSWELRAVLRGHTSPVSRVRFNSDGTRLVSGAGGGATRVWAVDLDDLINLARDELTRSLTDEECRQYLHVETCPQA